MAPFEDSNATPSALAVDDQETFREILRRLVSLSSGLSLAGEVDSGERAVAAVKKLQPDMVVMDVVMPGMGGIAAARRRKAERPATVVVLVSTTHSDDLPVEAESRADEVIWKAELRPGLLDSLWRTHGDAGGV